MNTKHLKNLLFGIIIVLIYSCGSDDSEPPEPPTSSTEKAISSITISGIEATIDESAKTISFTIVQTDLTSLAPAIVISENAVVSPASGASQDFTNPVTYTVTAEDGSVANYVVTVISSSIVPFTYNEKNYEIVKDNKTWVDASAFAVDRGGFLAEINNEAEQNAIFIELGNASIIINNTVAPDGGGASYIWIGGNDIATEGDWIWDGDNDQTGNQFWMGTLAGAPIGGLYNNWGDEPDDFGSGQDGLGLAITDWPFGVAGQWNDVDDSNTLYFLIEFD